MSDADEAVRKLLENNGITYHESLQGEGAEEGWKYDKWLITFTKNGNNAHFDFKTGTGHKRKLPGRDQAVPPSAASVLYCLLSDSSAYDVCFIEWASDCGYDADSIKARNIYDACCVNALKLKAIFSRDLIAELRELLQDY